MLTPYRTASKIEKYISSGPKHGLILLPKPAEEPQPKKLPPHKCKLPGYWTVYFLELFGRPLTDGSLWRCKECFKVYKFRHWKSDSMSNNSVKDCIHQCYQFCTWWTDSSVKDWINLGGDE